MASLLPWRLCCQCSAGFGAMGCLPYPPCSGVLEVSTVTRLFNHAFASPSSLSLLVAQLASVWQMLCRFVGRNSFRWMICHLYFVRMDALPSRFELIVPFGGCFDTSLGLTNALSLWFFFTFSGCFAAENLGAVTETV